MFLAVLAIIMESGIPTLFCNERAGEHGKKFNTLKFRTMYKKYCIGEQFSESKQALEYEQKLIKERSDIAGLAAAFLGHESEKEFLEHLRATRKKVMDTVQM